MVTPVLPAIDQPSGAIQHSASKDESKGNGV